ncbi:PREDICTED: neuropeptide F-like [Bactrocera latifrons]|uniref:neuropeptide F-like n=1 Tax=Bactrocera latifrons TaxID=174628 RepID=UPI0008DE777F|nr:PREDICTED: neuropeptide F-like [Bactrocera latifrons]
MSSVLRFALIVIVALALLTAHTATANNSRPPRNNDISNMADALKYLQDLDTYYGDRARVRFGKRAPLLWFLRQHLLENPDVVRAIENPAADEPF